MSQDAAIPICAEDDRRALVLGHPSLNGIDFVEYRFDPLAVPGRRHVLDVAFLKAAPALSEGDLAIEGGVRITGIGIVAVQPPADVGLRVFVTDAGDFSAYRLVVEEPETFGLDPLLAQAPINFRPGCPSDLDCRVEHACPEPMGERPLIDMMARDFASFRRMLLDFARARNPAWTETHPADPAVVLVELLAAAGDRLSWMQDAAATEGAIETCRLRVSARRHAMLVDYRIDEGRNAFAFVQLDITGSGTVPAGTKLLTRVTDPLRGQAVAPAPLIAASAGLDLDADPALQGVTVFETTARTRCDAALNRLWLHDFGGRACCLPKGATSAFLYAVAADGTASRPNLAVGDWLLLHEAKGPDTGAPPDANPARRACVRVVAVAASHDPAFRDSVDLLDAEPRLRAVTIPGQPSLPVLRVTWREEEAPTFPLTITGRDRDGAAVPHACQARGNIVPVDHGRTVITAALPAPVTRGRSTTLRLPAAPLTLQPMPEVPAFDETGRLIQSRHDLAPGAASILPSVVLLVETPQDGLRVWRPVADLLDSGPFDEHFATEIDARGEASLRFGDDAFGRRLAEDAAITARFRVGNGPSGNLGYGALSHIVEPTAAELVDPADPLSPAQPFAAVHAVWQPLPARGGSAPEALEAIRQRAPSAMHASQFRAVTVADWEAFALALPGVAAARAVLRWTGSWQTIMVALHPIDGRDLVPLPGGGAILRPVFAEASLNALNQVRLACHDLAVRAGIYVPLRVEIGLCLLPGHFRSAVVPLVRAVLVGAGGLFDPRLATFGATVYASRIIAAVMSVTGVSSAVLRGFHRETALPDNELATGRLSLGTTELARLDADANRPENGVLVLTIDGEGGQP